MKEKKSFLSAFHSGKLPQLIPNETLIGNFLFSLYVVRSAQNAAEPVLFRNKQLLAFSAAFMYNKIDRISLEYRLPPRGR